MAITTALAWQCHGLGWHCYIAMPRHGLARPCRCHGTAMVVAVEWDCRGMFMELAEKLARFQRNDLDRRHRARVALSVPNSTSPSTIQHPHQASQPASQSQPAKPASDTVSQTRQPPSPGASNPSPQRATGCHGVPQGVTGCQAGKPSDP